MRTTIRTLICSLLGICVLAAMAQGSELLEKVESHYNSIYVFKEGSYVTLAFGHETKRYVESRRNTEDLLELPVSYTRSLTAAIAYTPKVDNVLMIGMGGGSTSWYLHKHIPDASVTAVELDAEMIRLADKYFKMAPQPKLAIEEADGRLFLARDKSSYDVIMVDAYRGPFVPFHLLTREFFELAKAHLAPGGVLAQNVEPATMLFDSTYATLLQVFDQVDFIPGSGNVVAIAYDGKRRAELDLMRTARERQAAYGLRYPLTRMIGSRRRHEPPGDDVKPLTDDFAPVNILKAVKVHNRKWQ